MSDAPDTSVREAIREIRREQLTAAVLVAVIDASLTLVAVAVALSMFQFGALRGTTVGPVRGFVVVAAIAAVAVGAVEFYRRIQAPAVEQFEAANPPIAEALRTARDAVESGRDGPVVRRLYGDVLEALRSTSSRELLPWRRLAATLAIVAVLAVAGLGAQAAGIQVGDLPDVGIGGGPNGTEDTQLPPGSGEDPPDVLKPGDEVLGGSPGEITLGHKNLSLAIDALRGGAGQNESEGGGEGEFPSEEEPLEPQSAGYSPPEPVEEAELIRKYTLAIQGNQTNQ